jgi:hypothetical protein
MNSCNFIDILRKPKILDMSIFDWIATLFGGFLIAIYVLDLDDNTEIFVFEILIIFIGILVHKLFGINTMLGYYLGLNDKPIRKQCV